MGPLKGIKILEFSGIGPGPYCGMLLADMGADVIRVGRKGSEGLENKFDIHNRSKRSITADLKNEDTINEILKIIDKHKAPIVGVDIPSGIDSNTGQILGYAPYCDLVITFSSLK